MNKRSLSVLIAIVLLTAAFGVFALNGVSFGMYIIKPLHAGLRQGLDLAGGVSAVYQITNAEDRTPENLAAVEEVFRTRLNNEGYADATLAAQGSDKVRIEIPLNKTTGNVDPSALVNYLVTPAHVTFEAPQGTVLFEGKDMVDVGLSLSSSGQPAVGFILNDAATKIFADKTAELNGTEEPIYVVMDGNVISAPLINNGAITGGQGVIEGDFTYESARQLASQIRSGALPVDMNEVEVHSISATLGENTTQTGAMAVIVGLLIVAVLILVMYKLSGLIVDISLVIYALLFIFALATLDGIQLTMPGVAGIVLAIVIAIGSNVLILERVSEEISIGKSLATAIQSGFARAFPAILDGSLITILVTAVMFFLGTSTIRSFASTLLTGLIANFICSVFITRGLLTLMIGINANPALYTRIGATKKEAR